VGGRVWSKRYKVLTFLKRYKAIREDIVATI
jgi:hypothetical protein